MLANGSITLQSWDEEAWRQSRPQWQALLAASDGDPLFMSWDWQHLWWRHFGAPAGRRLHLLAVYRGQQLIGIAPLHSGRVRRRGLPVTSLEIIGSRWRDADSLVSEYLDVIAAPGDREAVSNCVLGALRANAPGCTEFVIANTRAGEHWNASLGSAPVRGLVRRVDDATSYQADLSQGFAAYVAALSTDARRKIWNLRRRLARRGHVTLEMVGEGQVVAAFDDMNRLHARRWGGELFRGARLEFHLEFARGAAARGELAMSRLLIDGHPVSVLYDVRIAGCQYNIQMGFDPQLDSGISLGVLHLGFAMEDAAAHGVTVYDFLAGPGRSENYKERFSQRTQALQCIQWVRNGWMANLYRLHRRLRPTDS